MIYFEVYIYVICLYFGANRILGTALKIDISFILFF